MPRITAGSSWLEIGHRIDAQDCDAQRATVERNAVDVGGMIVLDAARQSCAGKLMMRSPCSLPTKTSEKRGSGAAPPVPPCPHLAGIVDREGCLIEVALELEAGFLQELLVVGVVRDGRQLADRFQRPQPLEVDVEKSIGTGKQTSCFGRGAPPELDDRNQGGGDQQRRRARTGSLRFKRTGERL